MSRYKLGKNRDRERKVEYRISPEAEMYLLAFFLPVFISMAILKKNNVYPFGENCILHIDMYHQYAPFFTELMDKLKHGESLLYSFQIGLGSDFVSLFAYYLASPLNWLLIFCPKDHVIEFMTILIVFKIGLSGASFAWFVGKHFQTNDLIVSVFGCFYALSGYMAAYSWDIMWLDCVFLAPVILWGLELLVKEKKTTLYCLCLGIAILSNFYIAIMICIFCLIYFLILLFEEVPQVGEKIKTCGIFALYSLLAGGMGAVLIIPEAIMLSYSGSSGFSFPENFEMYFDIVSELARHCFDVEVYTGRDHWPNLYCGAAVLPLIFLYFLNRNISWKKKLVRAVLLLFFWVSFANNLLDFIWHGFHFPDSLPGRQSFLYIFLMLVLAYEAYHNREGNQIYHVMFSLGFTWAFLALCAFVADSGMVTAESIVLTGVLTGGYGALFFLWHVGKGEWNRLAAFTVVALAVIEVYANFGLTGFDVTSRTAYTKNWNSVKDLLLEIDSRDGTAFYRAEEMERLTKNDAALYHYSSSTIFSSLMNIGVGNFYRKMGMEGGKNFYSYSGSTPLSSAVLSVKYLISKSPCEASPLRTLAAKDGQNYIYQNSYTLPLGFMVEKKFEELWDAQKGRPIYNLNRLAYVLGAKEDLLTPLEEVQVEEDSTKITVKEDCYLYATYEDRTVTNITVTCNDRTRKFTKCDHGYILDLGWCLSGDTVEITNSSGIRDLKVCPYVLNIDVLGEAYEALNRQTFEPEFFSDTRIRGKIQVDWPGDLILSIPKEEGWHVFVDGEEIDSGTFMESFIKIPLGEGEHAIELRYLTPGLIPGAAISLSSLGIFCGILLWKEKKSNEIYKNT
ncbi:MAG: YfhO family protein [Roseburia sp.]|nr:YfhO family protein [Roseburia sp.]